MKVLSVLCAAAAAAASAVFVPGAAAQTSFTIEGDAGTTLRAEPLATFDSPWAMTFLPDGRALVTEKPGDLVLVSADGGRLGEIAGVPETDVVGQGGLADVVPHPDFQRNGLVYLSYIESGPRGAGAVAVRGQLELTEGGGRLTGIEAIWTQRPRLGGGRHFAARMAFGPDGMLYITSGDRGRQDPAQDMDVNLGKIVRLMPDGAVPADNPFADRGGVAAQFWTVGHRNPLGIDVAPDGRLWSNEMGPRGGDELNLIERGKNYGWPVVSDGINYSGVPIPDHAADGRFQSPAISWVPSISPAGLVIYDGGMMPGWRGDAVMGALSGRALVRVDIEGRDAREAERFSWNSRVRELAVAPDGALWVLEDGRGGRLLRLTPA